MQLYRIARSLYATDMSGTGARLYGGRWNNIGRSMVYTASSRSLAVLEVLVHLPPTIIPDDFRLITFDAPDDVFEPDVNTFPPNWDTYPEPDILKRTGDFFLIQNQHLLMKVPSAIVKQEYNYLINPVHAKAGKIKVIANEPFTFDERLLKDQ
ncbi:RES domain-containing protein [Mucilaginibacter yixingensis]|uniref:RES domain-containing protein n=1 Tax=Mucilaginibacter yixingensis TaxID=1295612 RepID=A0A2T5J782_9SPHI|nr:RES family NAD+ phosphorylase [Mucilaginibacter yixingensis]PTQ95005.1 RES domain-containing protein [Mucilaginibacter yixingensis]